MKNTACELRNNEIYGDMAAWLLANAEDNSADLRRLKRNLRRAREEELTPRQQELLQLHYEQNLTVTQIARQLGVNKSSVSRTLRRARERLELCLRYTI